LYRACLHRPFSAPVATLSTAGEGGEQAGALSSAAMTTLVRHPALLIGLLLATVAGTPAAAQAPASPPPFCAPDGSGTASYQGWPVPGRAQADGELIPYIVSTQLVAGPARILITLLNAENAITAAPDVPVTLALYDLAADPATPVATVEGSFIDPGTGRGLYRFATELRCAGDWGFEVTAGFPAGPVTAKVIASVRPAGTTPAIGSDAPRSESPVAETPEEIALISTDLSPEPSFYRSTIAQAVSSGKPSAILFGTPMFCQTGTCGPTIEILKTVAASFGDAIEVVHVEPYRLRMTEAGLQPELDADGRLQPIPAVFEWGLPTEPYLFVVDAEGRVAAGFEGVIGEDEVRAAIVAALEDAAAG